MDEELLQLAVKKTQLQIKLSAAKHTDSVLDKELDSVAKELAAEKVKQSTFKLASDALVRCQVERQYKDDKKHDSASEGQKLFKQLSVVNETIDKAKQAAMESNRELERKVAEFQLMTKGRNSPWVPEKQRMLEKLKQRREILSQIQLKIQQLDAQTKERRGLIDGHLRYPLDQFCINLAQFHSKMNKLRPCLVNEYRINQELKARNAQREQSLRESESMLVEQCPMDHSHKEPNRKVHDQHRDKDRSRQLELEKNTNEQMEQNHSPQNHPENHEVVLELDTEETDINELEKSTDVDNGDRVSLSLDQNQTPHQDRLDADEYGKRNEDDDMLFGFMGMDDGTEAQGNNMQKNLSAFSFSLHNRDESQGIGTFDFLDGGLGASTDETGKNAFDFFAGMNRTGNFDFMSGIEGAGDKDSTQGGFNFDF